MSKDRKRRQLGHANGCIADDGSTKRVCLDSVESLSSRLVPAGLANDEVTKPGLVCKAPNDDQTQYSTNAFEPEPVPELTKSNEEEMVKSEDFDDSSFQDQETVSHEFDTCFGMVRVHASNLRLSALLDSCDPSVEVALKIEGEVVTIRNLTSLENGGLLGRNTAASRALKELYHQHSASFEGYLLQSDTKARGKPSYDLHVIVYGMQSQSDCFGKSLDSAGLFLQHPHMQELSAPYRNPHYLCNPNSQIDFLEEANATFTTKAKCSKAAQVLEAWDPLRYQLRDVMDSAQGPQTFSSTSSSPRLKTRLKTHQSKALSMMKEKERGGFENNEFGSIWATLEAKKGGLRYKNLVTGSVQNNAPRVCRGGILADDMGLGKTLSTIALIASSLDMMTSFTDDLSNCRSTLIVCPLSLLQEWEKQILDHVHPGQMSYKVFHGATKKDMPLLNSYDVVLTTYDVVVSEALKSRTSSGAMTIHSIEWHRVVLDEAHTIRNRGTKRYRDVCALSARYRWCLTGTPIYNALDDFGTLLGFLGVYPFDKAATFNSRIGIPVKNHASQGLESLQRLVQGVCLRRTKDVISDELKLPACHKQICEVQFSEEERRNYDVLKKKYAAILGDEPAVNKAASPTARIFLTILRLRQFCDHGMDLLPGNIRELFENSADSKVYSKCLIRLVESCEVCGRALEQNSEGRAVFPLKDCGHLLCPGCEDKPRGKSMEQDTECIACAMRTDQETSEVDAEPNDDNQFRPSAKVLALLHNLSEERSRALHQPIKSIVFSSWTGMLDLVQTALCRQEFKFTRIDGGMSEIGRRSAIEKFRSETDCSILLASIGTAGVGLDLTVASRVHLLESQWTPMAEAQALDRVHRMGQTQDVVVTRYIVKDFIEEYLVNVQQVKSAVISQLFATTGQVKTESTRERLAKYLKEGLK